MWVPVTSLSLQIITGDRQVSDSHTGSMWAAGTEPAFKDTIKLGHIHGATHQKPCLLLPAICNCNRMNKLAQHFNYFGLFLGYLTI